MQIIHQAPLAVLGMGAAFTILWGVADPMAAFAEVREVEAEGYYMMGDSPEERMDIAQQHAIRDATKAAAEKAGVFVESFSEMRMGNLTRDEVRAISAIVLEVKEPTKVVPEVVANGQAIRYHAYVTAMVDTANIEKMLERSSAEKEDMVNKNKEMEAELARVNEEIERLKEAYRQAEAAEQQRINEDIRRNDRRFEALVWGEKGAKHFMLWEDEEARECFRKAVEIDPESAMLWCWLSACHSATGDFDQSIVCARKALDLQPDMREAWGVLGFAYEMQGQFSQAIEWYQKTGEMALLGRAYKSNGDYEQAIACATKSIQNGEDSATNWQTLGVSYYRLDQNEKAIECLRKAVAIEPRYDEAWRILGWAYAADGQYEQAVEAFTKGLELSNLADGWEGLGDAYLGLKQYEQAAEAYRKALDLDPSSSHGWNQLGVCYSYLDDNEKEIECFKKAVELNPNDQTIKENLDRALSRG